MFLGYLAKSKDCKFLNANTNKIVESTNVRIDEYAKKNEEECKKEQGYYRKITCVHEGISNTLLEEEEKATKQQQDANVEL